MRLLELEGSLNSLMKKGENYHFYNNFKDYSLEIREINNDFLVFVNGINSLDIMEVDDD